MQNLPSIRFNPEAVKRNRHGRNLLLASLSVWALDGALTAAHASEAGAPDASLLVADASAVDNGPTEVLVTARRRQEKAQDVPIAITSLGGKFLKEHEDVRLAQDVVSFAPNVNAAATDGRERPRWFIRGVGTNNTDANGVSQIGVYRDEVYIANVYAQAFPLFDQERVEVLSGPQGTLWGKNTTGGALSFISKAPAFTTDGYIRATAGSDSEWGIDGAIGGPIIKDKLAGRIAYYHDQDDGWYQNIYAGDVLPANAATGRDLSNAKTVGKNDETAIRGQLLYTPTNDLSILLSAHHREYKGDQTPSYILPDTYVAPINNPVYNQGYTDPANPLPYGYVWAADTGHENITNDGGLVRVNWNLGDLTLTSVTGYEANKLVRWSNGSTSIPLANGVSRQVTPDKQFSQEIRLASSATDRFNWIVGAYYFHEDNVSESWGGNLNDYSTQYTGGAKRSYTDVFTNTETESTALFGSATYAFTDKFKLTAGGRLNKETKTFSQAFTLGTGAVTFSNPEQWWLASSVSSPLVTNSVASAHRTYNSFTYDITPQYAFTDKILGYFHYSYGYLSGGFDNKKNTSVTPNTYQIYEYQPEELTVYEAGLKTQWYDNRLTANLSAFYYDYPSIQVLVILPSTGTNGNSTSSNIGQGYSNAAGWVKGVELTLDARPTPKWYLRGALGLLDTEYTSYPIQTGVNYPRLGLVNATIDPSGNTFTRAPNTTLFLSAERKAAFKNGSFLTFGLNYRYLSKQYYNPTLEFDHTLEQPAYGLVNGSVAYAFGPDNRLRLTLTGQNLSNEEYLIHAIAPTNNGSSARQGRPRSYLLSLSAQF